MISIKSCIIYQSALLISSLLRKIIYLNVTYNIVKFGEPNMELSFMSFVPPKFSFDLTENAARRINHLQKIEGKDNYGLRIEVQVGGCSGFIYEFSWLNLDKLVDESVIEKDGASVILAPSDFLYINGGVLDYAESLSESKFTVNNPNAVDTCSCGKSFA